jgi:serine O-acetyltransferase
MISALPAQVNRSVTGAIEYLDTIIKRDPSIRSRGEAAMHPTVVAMLGHRISRWFYQRRRYKAARALSVIARLASGGIEIHPGATIGRRFFVDHGCGVVIGETAVIGDDVTLFHQVTLGSTGWWNDAKRGLEQRRHPRLGNGVTVGANACVLGPITIGDHAMIGAQALVIADVPPGAVVHAPRGVLLEARTGRPSTDRLRLAPSAGQDAPALRPAALGGNG